MKFTFCFILLFVSCHLLLSQIDTLVQYDFKTQLYSDVLVFSDNGYPDKGETAFYIGEDLDVEFLDTLAPTENLFPNSQFRRKELASDNFDLSAYPLSTTVKYKMIIDGEELCQCSGSMISKKHILTAAHCLFDEKENYRLFSDTLLIYPAYDNGVSPFFYSSSVVKAYAPKSWSVGDGNDIMVLEIEDDLGLETGWIGLAYNTIDTDIEGQVFHKFSYPASNIFTEDTIDYDGEEMYHSYGVFDIVNPEWIGSDGAVGNRGESGSSIIGSDNGSYHTYGVMTWSNNIRHSRLLDWHFSAFADIISADNIVASDKIERRSASLYPNPASEEISFRLADGDRVLGYKIYDGLGRNVKTKFLENLARPEVAIEISDLNIGSYVLEIIFEEYKSVTQFMKM